ncbi:MAG: DUF2344 domain-containing protein, partial [candidate division Zixibacteria bacterium]|nr:DUF2344 domain-containing protein [candidate division Zixibacteria bacterium]
RIDDILAERRLEIERKAKSGTKLVDMRPGIYELTIVEDRLEMLLGVGEGVYVRPTEVAGLLLTDESVAVSGLPFHRKSMYRRNDDGSITSAMEL